MLLCVCACGRVRASGRARAPMRVEGTKSVIAECDPRVAYLGSRLVGLRAWLRAKASAQW